MQRNRWIAALLGLGVFLSGCAWTRKSWEGKVSPATQALWDALDAGETVKLALHSDQPPSPIHAEVSDHLYSRHRNALSDYEKFSLVEKAEWEALLERGRQETGQITRYDMVRLAKEAGITHIVFWDYWNDEATCEGCGIISLQLVDTSSGRVRADQWLSWVPRH